MNKLILPQRFRRVRWKPAKPYINRGIIPAFAPTAFMPKAVSTFDPLTLITGAGGFWRADKGVTGNPNVTAWADQSTFAQNLTGTNSPQFSATGWLSSFPGIAFANASTRSCSNSSFVFSTSTCSAFALLSVSSVNSNDGYLALVSSSTSYDYLSTNCFSLNTNASTCGLAISQHNLAAPVSQNFSLNTPALVGVTFDGTNATGWLNGSSAGFNNNPVGQTELIGSSSSIFVLGARYPGSIANFFTGTIAFAGITQKVMNTTDWTNLKNWSNSNWGTSF